MDNREDPHGGDGADRVDDALDFLAKAEKADAQIRELIGFNDIEKVPVPQETLIQAIRTLEYFEEKRRPDHAELLSSIEGIVRSFFSEKPLPESACTMTDIPQIAFIIDNDDFISLKCKLLLDAFIEALAHTCERRLKTTLSARDYESLVENVQKTTSALFDDDEEVAQAPFLQLENEADIISLATGEHITAEQASERLTRFQKEYHEAVYRRGMLPIDPSDSHGQSILKSHLRSQASSAASELRILNNIEENRKRLYAEVMELILKKLFPE